MRRFLTAAGVAGIVLLSIAGTALGHADLVSSAPADGTTIEVLPIPIVLTFDEALTAGSTVEARDASGAIVATGSIDPADETRLIIDPATILAGAIELRWTSVGDDGDILRGIVQFTYAPPTPPPPTAAPSPIATPAPGDSGSDNTSDVILPIVVGLIAVALVAWRVLRRGPTGS